MIHGLTTARALQGCHSATSQTATARQPSPFGASNGPPGNNRPMIQAPQAPRANSSNPTGPARTPGLVGTPHTRRTAGCARAQSPRPPPGGARAANGMNPRIEANDRADRHDLPSLPSPHPSPATAISASTRKRSGLEKSGSPHQIRQDRSWTDNCGKAGHGNGADESPGPGTPSQPICLRVPRLNPPTQPPAPIPRPWSA